MNGTPDVYDMKEVAIDLGDDRTIDFPLPPARFLAGFELQVFLKASQAPVDWFAYQFIHDLANPKDHVLRIRFKDRGTPRITDPSLVGARLVRMR